MKYIIFTIFGYMISVFSAQASTNIQIKPPTDILPEINTLTTERGAPIATIIAWGISLTAVLTIIAITWAGIRMVLAVGEEEKMKQARHTMIYAFIGLIIAGLAYATVNLVVNLDLNSFL